MKTNELRLGNWIYPDKNIFPMQVESVGDTYVYCDFEGNEGDAWESDLEQMHGISLTEELLLKCGFEMTDSGHPKDHEDYHEWLEKVYPTIGCAYSGDGDYVFFEKFDDQKIYYLHQLQNIYHALTGEELEIKL